MGIFFPSLPDAGQPTRPLFSLTGAAAAHAALIGFVAVVVPADELRKVIEPMTVRLVEIPPDAPKPPPQPKRNLPPPSPQLLASTTPSEAPAAFAVPPQPPQPPSPVPAAPINIAPAPVAITAARFDADYLDNPKPVYPLVARRLGEQGKVLLRVYVSAAGLAEKVELKTGSGFARLDQAATDAVSRWRFVPARRGDQAFAAWVQVPITFQLES
ncbi:energy transducer TonB [Sulfuritalea sp.]|uniref:energy transducer TonB n=1 Tax=Sulfuritalea sp. TaxID=2480090 RepID=UPI00286DE71F|nr:energy transducer TonB [Sulfuritalea sp.]